jgi:L,D-peptidoglycan transpeptidase YkuD (ErfK/YbiS/YcfS/YnhG family)
MKYLAKNLRKRRIAPLVEPDRNHFLSRLVATRLPGATRSEGRLQAGQQALRCALGAAGVRRDKREGDHASPAGSWRLLSGFYRADKVRARSPYLRPIRKTQAWCDDPASPLYNRPVVSPFSRSHEKLWRDDDLYDIVIILDYNISPRRKGRGSAIFLHCARPGFAPTEGCVALAYDDLRRLLPRLSRNAVLTIR